MTSVLATIIKARRLVRGMEQGDLASTIGCDARSVIRWEAGDLPSARHLVALRNALDLSIGEMEDLVVSHLEGDATRLRIEGASVMTRLGWTTQTLLEHVLDLERRTLGITEPQHCGTVEGLTEIFEALPDSWRVLTRGDAVMGVWHFMPLTEEAYGRMRRGKLCEGAVTLADVQTLDLPGTVDICLSSLAVDRDVKTPGALALLLRSLLDVASMLSRRDVTIREVCAQAWTPAALLMCRRLGFRHSAMLQPAPKPVPVMEVDFETLRAHRSLIGFVGPRDMPAR